MKALERPWPRRMIQLKQSRLYLQNSIHIKRKSILFSELDIHFKRKSIQSRAPLLLLPRFIIAWRVIIIIIFMYLVEWATRNWLSTVQFLVDLINPINGILPCQHKGHQNHFSAFSVHISTYMCSKQSTRQS